MLQNIGLGGVVLVRALRRGPGEIKRMGGLVERWRCFGGVVVSRRKGNVDGRYDGVRDRFYTFCFSGDETVGGGVYE